MDRFIAIVVPEEKTAYKNVEVLEGLHQEGSVTLYATAVLQRQPDGTLLIKQQADVGPVGTALGSVIGALIGLVGGPAGIVAGTLGGGLVGTWGQYGVHAEVSEDFAEDLIKEMKPGEFVVIAEVDEDWTAPIDTKIGELGGRIIRESRTAYVEDLFHRRVDEEKERLQRFKTDRASEKAESMEASLEREIRSTAEKLRRKAGKAQERMDHEKQEMDAKVKRLQEQAAKAKPDVKNRIEQRLATLRQDYDGRLQKLRRAYDLTQEALGG